MLEDDISNIIYFIQAKRVNPFEPGGALFHRLEESEGISKTGLIVYNFETNALFFANESACSFLGIDNQEFDKYGDAFLESVIHPISYQFLQYNIRLNQLGSSDSFSGIYFLKTQGKSKYAWVYTTAKIMSFTASGIPGLIYISFVEVNKAMECYLKILHGSSTAVCEASPMELLNSLKSREVEMLNLIAAEYSSKEMADKLNITQAALDAARKRLIKKLGVKSVAGLVKIAISLGLSGQEMAPKFQNNRNIRLRPVTTARFGS